MLGGMSDVTQILSAIEAGDPKAAEELLPLVYDELRKLAAARLAEEKPGQTLQATALVHEASVRLVGSDAATQWNGRGHFFAAAAEAMRRILVDQSRRRQAAKRGGQIAREELRESLIAAPEADADILAVNEALEQLSAVDPVAARLVGLRFFAGGAVGRAAPDRVMDGQSLTPLLGQGAETQNWRKDFLVELYRHLPPAQNGDVSKALRTEHEVYVEYRSGPRELYDHRTDPYQVQNIYATADPDHIADLSARLAELAVSRGNPPTIESVVINDGSAQRSMITSLTVTFDRVVTFDPGAFGLQRNDGTEVSLNVAASEVDGRTIAILTFTGPSIIGGSLADGTYVLTIQGDRIRDEFGRELDGDRDGNGGGNQVDAFFRLFGDSDGDSDVDWLDRDFFRSAFEATDSDVGYLWSVDFDGNGDVDGRDNGQFNRRFGQA